VAINNAGIVAGATIMTESPYTSLALRWGATTTTPTTLYAISLPFNTPIPRFAQDMNESGVIVGASATLSSALSLTPAKWNANTQNATALANFADNPNTIATHITDTNFIGGITSSATLDNPVPDARPVRWNASGQISELAHLSTDVDGFSQSLITQMNNTGTAVGVAELYANDGTDLGQRAVRWGANATSLTQLQAPDVSEAAAWESEAVGVNNAGVTIGNSFRGTDVTFEQRALRWQADSASFELLRNTGNVETTESGASAINNLGTIAGYANALNATAPHAVIWPKGSNIAVDLNSRINLSGWELQAATHVSDTGFVAGLGMFDPDTSGPTAAYAKLFLMLVPEAGTYGMGDANFDTLVNFTDLLIVAQNYGQSNPNQSFNVGDFDLNGTTDFLDLLPLAQNYGFAQMTNDQVDQLDQFTSSFLNDWSMARANVPEPTLIALAPLTLIALRRRR
ncbi:MAG TPA: hypothetical protein PK402_10925, partial [Tepidisphaeraceae bacterium]|nr:hypothetical protein [Tepidisphaeraceae bacterium]